MFNFLKIMFSKDTILHLILCSQERLYLIILKILYLIVMNSWQFLSFYIRDKKTA